MFVDFPAKNTVYTLYSIYGSGQPYIYTHLNPRHNSTLSCGSSAVCHSCGQLYQKAFATASHTYNLAPMHRPPPAHPCAHAVQQQHARINRTDKRRGPPPGFGASGKPRTYAFKAFRLCTHSAAHPGGPENIVPSLPVVVV